MLMGGVGTSTAQTLTCRDAPSAGCPRYHFHVLAWSPEFRSTTELSGFQSFATAAACERERARREGVNAEALAFLAAEARRMKTQANVHGECHCDMTYSAGHPNFLDEPMRRYQVRTDQEYRLQLMSVLIERGLAPASPLSLALGNPSQPAGLRIPSVTSIPQEDGLRLIRPDEVRILDTTVLAPPEDDGRWQNDLKLATISIDRLAATPDTESAESVRPNPFIRSETFRIREIVLAASDNDDPAIGRVLRACAERMQVVSKLDRLIRSSPADGALRRASEAAMYDDSTLTAFITALFGPGPAARWDPPDPADMAIELPDRISADPLAVLQDGEQRYTEEEQKLALYAFLVRNPLSPGEEPWVRSIAESWLVER